MTPIFASRNTYISHYTTNTSSRNKDTLTFAPNIIKLIKKTLIIFYISHLADSMLFILFKRPIWWRCYYKVYGFIRNPGKVARITQI